MTRLQKEDRDPLARKLLACSALKECRDRLVAAYDFSKGKLMEVVVLLQDKRLGYPLPSFYTKTPAWLTVQPVQHSTSAADLNSVLKVAFSWQSGSTWASPFTLSCKGGRRTRTRRRVPWTSTSIRQWRWTRTSTRGGRAREWNGESGGRWPGGDFSNQNIQITTIVC